MSDSKPFYILTIKLGTVDTKTKLDNLRKNMRNLGGVQTSGDYGSVTQEFAFPITLDKFERSVVVDTVYNCVTPTSSAWSTPPPAAPTNKEEKAQ